MSKKLSPLEALEDIILYLNANEPEGLYCENIKILKKALKEYEELQNDYCKVVEERGKWQKETHKKLKALEIILNKGIDRLMIEIYEDYIGYNNNHNSRACDLTKEEFDLLKEWLK